MLGQHIIVDLYGVDAALLDDNERLGSIMRAAVDASSAQYLGHKFEPQGCSGIILIAESHLAWHSWPEYNFVSVDYFTCGAAIDAMKAIEVITQQLQPHYSDQHQLNRGRFVVPPTPIEPGDAPRPRLVCIDGDA